MASSLKPVVLLALTASCKRDTILKTRPTASAATGREVRAHRVCGHWRNQWYASTQEHHTIWIDGFVRGDGDLGIVTGPKVYLA